MRAVEIPAGAGSQHPPLPLRSRAGSFAALFLLLSCLHPLPGTAQATGGWSFQDDAFTDLWFHGLAMVGLHGQGAAPLYDPAYAAAVRSERARAGLPPTRLEGDRGTLLRSFQGDEAFDVLHFVPLYVAGAGREEALRALRAVAAAPAGEPGVTGPARLGAQVVARLLPDAPRRRALGAFLDALDEEWREVVAPRRAKEPRTSVQLLADAWTDGWAAPLAGFLEAEGLREGTVFAVPALGSEGRFLARSPVGDRPLVVVGAPAGASEDAVLGALLRELCYPAVRRAMAPFEDRFDDRRSASRASDLAATRCGELLLERNAPERLAAYRTRFGLPVGGMGPGFLSSSGTVPGAAAWEGRLESALRRELKLDSDGTRAPARPVWRR